jgi:hypothetical protein
MLKDEIEKKIIQKDPKQKITIKNINKNIKINMEI